VASRLLIRKPVVVVARAFFYNNGDRKIDKKIYDKDGDGKWDYSSYDVDYDGTIDLLGFHPDGDINASSYEKYKG